MFSFLCYLERAEFSPVYKFCTWFCLRPWRRSRTFLCPLLPWPSAYRLHPLQRGTMKAGCILCLLSTKDNSIRFKNLSIKSFNAYTKLSFYQIKLKPTVIFSGRMNRSWYWKKLKLCYNLIVIITESPVLTMILWPLGLLSKLSLA